RLCVFGKRQGRKVIVREAGRTWLWDQRQNLRRDRVDHAGGYYVVGKQRPAGTIGIAGKRVVDRRGGRHQIPAAEIRSGNANQVGVGAMVQNLEIVPKNEQFVSNDRPAEVSAEVVVGEVADGRVEEVAGVGSAV